jgi:hypothetical protein
MITPMTIRPNDMSTWWPELRRSLARILAVLLVTPGVVGAQEAAGSAEVDRTAAAQVETADPAEVDRMAAAQVETADPAEVDPAALAPAQVDPAEVDPATARSEEADVPPVVDVVGFDRRVDALDAREQRMSLWESELARRAQGETYFADLEGYVTPRELLSTLVLAILGGAVLSLVGMRLLERAGLWRSAARQTHRDLEALERRVLTGLRELDQLLARLTDRVLAEPPAPASDGRAAMPRASATTNGNHPASRTRTPSGPAGEPPAPAVRRSSVHSGGLGTERLGLGDDPELSPPPPVSEERLAAGRPAGESRRTLVLDLARRGYDPEEIGRRAQLGPAEVSFILRLAATR